MDVDPSTSKPSTSSDLMKLIDNANCVTAIPETEQWTVRGWPKGMAMFHKNNSQCCNEYVAHTVRPCKDEGMNLPRQAIGDAITTAWLELMRDLERNAEERTLDDCKDLEDDVAWLKAKLESSQSALASKRSRVERRNETIRDLKDEIEALKHPQSTRPGAQASCSARPSSCPTAPPPARAQSGLAVQISQLGLASRMDAHPAADRVNDPPPDASMPESWGSDPGWGSEASVWEHMRGPNDPPKALSKKCKKKGIEYQSYGVLAVHEKVTRDYLTRSSTHTVDDEALTAELWSARQDYALQQAEIATTMVLLFVVNWMEPSTSQTSMSGYG
jgi:hypothetical protein